MTDGHEQRTDQAIQATLKVIGDPALPDGMEARLQAALRQRKADAADAPRWRWSLSPVRTLAVAGVALFAVTAVLLRQTHPHKPETTTASVGQQPLPERTPPAPVNSERQAQRVTPRIQRAIWGAPVHRLIAPLPHLSQPMDESQRNQPAPPLPLTEEERLLLRLARRGEPLQMAALDDAQMRSIDFAAQKTQFDDFFYLHTRETLDEDK